MALFLITCVYDEGVYEGDFRVLEASSREAIAKYILDNYESFKDFVESSVFYEWIYDEAVCPEEVWEKTGGRMIITHENSDELHSRFQTWFLKLSPEEVLEWIDKTHVDGDSQAQLAIYEITEIIKV
jgi:hypothetical protein